MHWEGSSFSELILPSKSSHSSAWAHNTMITAGLQVIPRDPVQLPPFPA